MESLCFPQLCLSHKPPLTTQLSESLGDEYAEKEAEKERGDKIKKFHKTILQTQNLGRMVNREGTKWGLGRKKSATIREIGHVP